MYAVGVFVLNAFLGAPLSLAKKDPPNTAPQSGTSWVGRLGFHRVVGNRGEVGAPQSGTATGMIAEKIADLFSEVSGLPPDQFEVIIDPWSSPQTPITIATTTSQLMNQAIEHQKEKLKGGTSPVWMPGQYVAKLHFSPELLDLLRQPDGKIYDDDLKYVLRHEWFHEDVERRSQLNPAEWKDLGKYMAARKWGSQHNEFQADIRAMIASMRAGEDPQAAIRTSRKLAEEEKKHQAKPWEYRDAKSVTSYLNRSHPNGWERVEALQQVQGALRNDKALFPPEALDRMPTEKETSEITRLLQSPQYKSELLAAYKESLEKRLAELESRARDSGFNVRTIRSNWSDTTEIYYPAEEIAYRGVSLSEVRMPYGLTQEAQGILKPLQEKNQVRLRLLAFEALRKSLETRDTKQLVEILKTVEEFQSKDATPELISARNRLVGETRTRLFEKWGRFEFDSDLFQRNICYDHSSRTSSREFRPSDLQIQSYRSFLLTLPNVSARDRKENLTGHIIPNHLADVSGFNQNRWRANGAVQKVEPERVMDQWFNRFPKESLLNVRSFQALIDSTHPLKAQQEDALVKNVRKAIAQGEPDWSLLVEENREHEGGHQLFQIRKYLESLGIRAPALDQAIERVLPKLIRKWRGGGPIIKRKDEERSNGGRALLDLQELKPKEKLILLQEQKKLIPLARAVMSGKPEQIQKENHDLGEMNGELASFVVENALSDIEILNPGDPEIASLHREIKIRRAQAIQNRPPLTREEIIEQLRERLVYGQKNVDFHPNGYIGLLTKKALHPDSGFSPDSYLGRTGWREDRNRPEVQAAIQNPSPEMLDQVVDGALYYLGSGEDSLKNWIAFKRRLDGLFGKRFDARAYLIKKIESHPDKEVPLSHFMGVFNPDLTYEDIANLNLPPELRADWMSAYNWKVKSKKTARESQQKLVRESVRSYQMAIQKHDRKSVVEALRESGAIAEKLDLKEDWVREVFAEVEKVSGGEAIARIRILEDASKRGAGVGTFSKEFGRVKNAQARAGGHPLKIQAEWATEPETARIVYQRAIAAKDLEAVSRLKSVLTPTEKEAAWKIFFTEDLGRKAYNVQAVQDLLQKLYSDYPEGMYRKINEVANHYRMGIGAIDQLKGKLFPRDDVALLAKDLQILKDVIQMTDGGTEDIFSFIRYLQGQQETPPSMAVGVIAKLNEIRNDSNHREYAAYVRGRKSFRYLDSPQKLREFFQGTDIRGRAAMIIDLISPNSPRGLLATAENKERLLDMMITGIEKDNIPFAKASLRAYMAAMDKVGNPPAHVFVTQMIAARTGKSDDRSDAEKLKGFIESKGTLWQKIGQQIYSDPYLIADPATRAVFGKLNDEAAVPAREDALEMLKKEMGSEYSKVRRVEPITKAGTINVMMMVELKDGRKFAARVVKKDPDSDAGHEIRVVREFIQELQLESERTQDPALKRQIAKVQNAMSEYVEAIATKIMDEVDLSREAKAAELVSDSYTRKQSDLNVSSQLVHPDTSAIEFGEGKANASRIVLYPLIQDVTKSLTPSELMRLRKAQYRTEWEALFVHGKYDPDGHEGNMLSTRGENGELISHRIDYSQAEFLPEPKLEAFRTTLTYFFNQTERLGSFALALPSISEAEFMTALRQVLTAPTVSDQEILSTQRELLKSNPEANPIEILNLLQAKLKEKHPGKVTLDLRIKYAMKSVLTSQQLLVGNAKERQGFAAEVFVETVLRRPRILARLTGKVVERLPDRRVESTERQTREDEKLRTSTVGRILETPVDQKIADGSLVLLKELVTDPKEGPKIRDYFWSRVAHEDESVLHFLYEQDPQFESRIIPALEQCKNDYFAAHTAGELLFVAAKTQDYAFARKILGFLATRPTYVNHDLMDLDPELKKIWKEEASKKASQMTLSDLLNKSNNSMAYLDRPKEQQDLLDEIYGPHRDEILANSKPSMDYLSFRGSHWLPESKLKEIVEKSISDLQLAVERMNPQGFSEEKKGNTNPNFFYDHFIKNTRFIREFSNLKDLTLEQRKEVMELKLKGLRKLFSGYSPDDLKRIYGEPISGEKYLKLLSLELDRPSDYLELARSVDPVIQAAVLTQLDKRLSSTSEPGFKIDPQELSEFRSTVHDAQVQALTDEMIIKHRLGKVIDESNAYGGDKISKSVEYSDRYEYQDENGKALHVFGEQSFIYRHRLFANNNASKVLLVSQKGKAGLVEIYQRGESLGLPDSVWSEWKLNRLDLLKMLDLKLPEGEKRESLKILVQNAADHGALTEDAYVIAHSLGVDRPGVDRVSQISDSLTEPEFLKLRQELKSTNGTIPATWWKKLREFPLTYDQAEKLFSQESRWTLSDLENLRFRSSQDVENVIASSWIFLGYENYGPRLENVQMRPRVLAVLKKEQDRLLVQEAEALRSRVNTESRDSRVGGLEKTPKDPLAPPAKLGPVPEAESIEVQIASLRAKPIPQDPLPVLPEKNPPQFPDQTESRVHETVGKVAVGSSLSQSLMSVIMNEDLKARGLEGTGGYHFIQGVGDADDVVDLVFKAPPVTAGMKLARGALGLSAKGIGSYGALTSWVTLRQALKQKEGALTVTSLGMKSGVLTGSLAKPIVTSELSKSVAKKFLPPVLTGVAAQRVAQRVAQSGAAKILSATTGPFGMAALAIGDMGAMTIDWRSAVFYGSLEEVYSQPQYLKVQLGPGYSKSILTVAGIEGSIRTLQTNTRSETRDATFKLELKSLSQSLAMREILGLSTEPLNSDDPEKLRKYFDVDAAFALNPRNVPKVIQELCEKKELKCTRKEKKYQRTTDDYRDVEVPDFSGAIAQYLLQEKSRSKAILQKEWDTALASGKADMEWVRFEQEKEKIKADYAPRLRAAKNSAQNSPKNTEREFEKIAAELNRNLVKSYEETIGPLQATEALLENEGLTPHISSIEKQSLKEKIRAFTQATSLPDLLKAQSEVQNHVLEMEIRALKETASTSKKSKERLAQINSAAKKLRANPKDPEAQAALLDARLEMRFQDFQKGLVELKIDPKRVPAPVLKTIQDLLQEKIALSTEVYTNLQAAENEKNFEALYHMDQQLAALLHGITVSNQKEKLELAMITAEAMTFLGEKSPQQTAVDINQALGNELKKLEAPTQTLAPDRRISEELAPKTKPLLTPQPQRRSAPAHAEPAR